MKSAWRTYKYVGKKNGKSFAECLKSAWRLAKLSVSMEENRAKSEARMAEEAKVKAEYRASHKTERADYNGFISHSTLYGRGFVSGGFVGD